jgi:hypothetical protein
VKFLDPGNRKRLHNISTEFMILISPTRDSGNELNDPRKIIVLHEILGMTKHKF